MSQVGTGPARSLIPSESNDTYGLLASSLWLSALFSFVDGATFNNSEGRVNDLNGTVREARRVTVHND